MFEYHALTTARLHGCLFGKYTRQRNLKHIRLAATFESFPVHRPEARCISFDFFAVQVFGVLLFFEIFSKVAPRPTSMIRVSKTMGAFDPHSD
jgi:hypothetical protein